MQSDEITRTRVCIVGAGFSGLALGVRLRDSGVCDFLILDGGKEVGGTWRDNHYPGCACDVPSRLYSFSFEQNPYWSRKFAPQAEIWAYLQHCAKKYALVSHIHLGRELRHASFNEELGCWQLECQDGSRYESQVLVAAMGGLSRPTMPVLPGLASFRGPAFHSARWRHDVSLEGKTVGVIGTGASAIQFVPQIVDRVGSLVLFQRTPPWILPRRDRPIRGAWQALYRRIPVVQSIARALVYTQMESRALGLRSFPSLLKIMETRARAHIRSSIRDPLLREQVTPGFRLGCKRVLLSDDYYPALEHSSLRLETSALGRVMEDGVELVDGRRINLDVLIFGTGFQATSPIPAGMLTGRSGLDLADCWKEGPEAYLGTVVSGFPNMFVLMGPNTGLGHNSVVYMIESQVAYILQCLEHMQKQGLQRLEVRAEVQAGYNEFLQRQFVGSVWSSGCASWYLHASGKNTTLWPGMSFSFRRRTRRFESTDYYDEVYA
ncbi:MAG: NAD(P)/FAD-dependent oxidoreductase [Gammaproteobacteria bacterium]|jgi:cation diffusion facilitator CzcD-associated flavoprotein CzcO|nr:NAD(P)/FAD-dependent oxidoreductase [Gammaproteobacteria bacterium]